MRWKRPPEHYISTSLLTLFRELLFFQMISDHSVYKPLSVYDVFGISVKEAARRRILMYMWGIFLCAVIPHRWLWLPAAEYWIFTLFFSFIRNKSIMNYYTFGWRWWSLQVKHILPDQNKYRALIASLRKLRFSPLADKGWGGGWGQVFYNIYKLVSFVFIYI